MGLFSGLKNLFSKKKEIENTKIEEEVVTKVDNDSLDNPSEIEEVKEEKKETKEVKEEVKTIN